MTVISKIEEDNGSQMGVKFLHFTQIDKTISVDCDIIYENFIQVTHRKTRKGKWRSEKQRTQTENK